MAAAVGTIGLGSSLAGGLLSSFGAMAQGQAQSKMYAYQAQVAQINAQIDKQNADYARTVGDIQTQNYGLKAAQTEGQIRAAQGASGLDVNSGSATDVQQSQRTVAKMDMDQIRANAAKTAYDYEVKSTNDVNQAGLYNSASSNARKAGILSGLGSLIGTAGSVSSKWLAGAQSGLWGSGGGGGSAPSGITLYGPNQEVVGYYA